ncbi:origin recognition complex subunit 5 C-terminus-domain-containing protein [Cyathus striatus]|nr:origin recognition complex subunit 5 C-terminus-domain-containing protein [Cyathus striatus]
MRIKLATVTLALASLAAATPARRDSCTTGALQCCDSVQAANSPATSTLLSLLGIAVQDVTAQVGLTCSPISAVGVGGNACTAQPACCTDNSFNGVVALGCTPINIEPANPGYETFIYEFTALVSSYPPESIYISDSESPRTTANVVHDVLESLSSSSPSSTRPVKIHYASIDGISCFNARLFYDSVINQLAGWEPEWEEGCIGWGAESHSERWNESLDTFFHGLNALYRRLCKENGVPLGGKQEREEEEWEDIRFVLVVQHPERLRENIPELMVPLTRMPEMARLDITVVFVSQVQWEDIRPPYGAAPEPFFMDVAPLSKESIVRQLTSNYRPLSESSPKLYPAALEPFYTHFITLVCDVCYSFTHDPNELAYIAAARWPGFVQPLLDDWEAHKRETMELGEGEGVEEEIPLEPPTEDIRLRLIRLYTPSITSAMESLLPRFTNAKQWSEENMPSEDIFLLPRGAGLPVKGPAKKEEEEGLKVLPRMSKFILIAAYVASTNPAKSDLRMFGRGLDEKKRKRKARKATVGAAAGASKLPQRLLGPMPFPLDRMIAILGAILEENDVESRVPLQGVGWDDPIPGEETDMEIGRVGIYSNIMQLTSMRLLHRTSPGDRLDGPPVFKCGIGYEAALELARDLKVTLGELLWDPV